MDNDKEGRSCADAGGKFHSVQPLRDLESNWAVDLAKNLEEYLLKICSGEITGEDDGHHLSVNFAEAALLLQGSIQVYSRKVEYLYSLVLHALEFISQKSQQTQHSQPESNSAQPEESSSHASPAEEDDSFWGFDDIPVEARNSLDSATCRDASSNDFVKPPANLVVLEGDCLDAPGDGGELESYLLATKDLYRDFILLDSCDAVAVNDFLRDSDIAEPGDLDDDNDPWKPLNPHEPGNLKVKPFKKVNMYKKEGINTSKRVPITTEFPLARLHGAISSEFTEIWEKQYCASRREKESQSPPLYDKLRQSLVLGVQNNFDTFGNPENDNQENGYDNGDHDFGGPDFDMPEYMHEDVNAPPEKDDASPQFDTNEASGHGDPTSHVNLEDLCRSHMDSLLASIAETEKQTELAVRVSTWKQRIEQNLEEQDSRPPFDIHEYGERVWDKLSLEADSENSISFTEVVKGQEKHDVAQTFSALLQLVNNGNVGLERVSTNAELACCTAVNPFKVRLLRHAKRRQDVQLRSSKKIAKSSLVKGHNKECRNESEKENRPPFNSSLLGSTSTTIATQMNCKFSLKLGKGNRIRCTPASKRRRRSQLIEPFDIHSSGCHETLRQ